MKDLFEVGFQGQVLLRKIEPVPLVFGRENRGADTRKVSEALFLAHSPNCSGADGGFMLDCHRIHGGATRVQAFGNGGSGASSSFAVTPAVAAMRRTHATLKKGKVIRVP